MQQRLGVIRHAIKQDGKPLVTRFAPSPTGYLHLGHVLSLIYVHVVADAIGAKVLLRIEDHDRQRCLPKYEQAILDDIAWLGLFPHNWHQFSQRGRLTSFRQSDRLERYLEVQKRLIQEGKAYYCSCSRKQVLEKQPLDHPELYYPGFCRKKQLISSQNTGLRWRITSQIVAWSDALLGTIEQDPAQQCGDLLIRDRHGNFTYNFCVVVDDLDQGVNLVVRGTDLLHCSARQVLLARELQGTPPDLFYHHPLLTDAQQHKLSKRFKSTGIIQRREAGESPAAVLGDALWLAGNIEAPREIAVEELKDILRI